MALPAGWPAMSLAKAHEILTAPGSRFETAMETIRGIPTRTWKNCPPTNREVFLAGRQYGDREFLVYEDDRCTYETFARATLKLAAQLQKDGVKKGDRIAIIMRNLPEWPVAFYAAELVGAIVTPLNAWWTGPELEYGLVDSGTKIAFVDPERLERVAEHIVNCPDLKKLYVSRSQEDLPSPIVRRLEDVIGKVNEWSKLPPGEMPNVALHPEDDATILYTSGTTGKPKGALGTQRNLTSNIMAAGFSAARSFLRRGEPVPVVANPLDAPQRATLLSVRSEEHTSELQSPVHLV